ncbi:hypothetical protein CC80DRAFT_14866 [Byssothecium circinans]|uniref:N-acetylgalactosaminide beta-1,3-galactosyltransferase n=1 Tax=Byssothecium circinans TaxID=147558 RepID=A0A6A5U160_9PLEO|nr:hypothetical protein CC80DRAFT_14866 [Byssothecium circinans]
MVRLSPARLLCAAILLCTFFLVSSITNLLHRRRGFDPFREHPPPAQSRPFTTDVHYGEECSPFKAGLMEDVAIILKMGTGDVATQLPAYLNRLGRCKQDLLFFSDRAAEYYGWHIIDALGSLRPEYKYHNPDFDVYDRIQRAETTEERSRDGWRLDKYKLLPMMELTWRQRPNKNWFVFLELDTYVNWDNMHRFLSHFDPETPHYFGSPVWPRKKTVFAHSGSGIVLSRAALNKLMSRGRMFAENHHAPGTHLFGQDMTKECCGDEVLAKVLKQSGVSLRGYWPMFNGETPSTARFGGEQWCEAILTLHQMSSDDYAGLERWESSRRHPSEPLTFEELFTYIEPSLRERVDDWTNMSDNIIHRGKHVSTKSFDACHAACMKDRKCIQFEHFGNTCRLSHIIRLGHRQTPEGNTRWTSGWMMNRMQAFKNTQTECNGAHFVHANP